MFLSFILAITQFLLITIIVFQEYRRKSIGVFLWAMLLILFGIMHLSTVIASYHDYPMWVYNYASLFVIIFCMLYIITRKIFTYNKSITVCFKDKWLKVSPQSITKTQYIYIYITFCILCFCVWFRINELSKFSGSIMDTSWGSMREMSSVQNYANAGQLVTCLYCYSSSSILLFYYWKKTKMAILSGLLVFSCVIISRNRVEVLPLLVAIIAYFIYNGTNLTIKKIMMLLFIGVFSVVLIYALQIFRYYGSIYNFITNFDYHIFFDRIFTNMSEGKGDIGLREVFYYFIFHDNQFENFGEGHTYLRMLMFFIPTQWSAGLKPPDFAISMGKSLGTGDIGFSVHPTLFGDCFANFGYWGALMGIVWALFVTFTDNVVNKYNSSIKISFIILYSNAYIVIGRGAVYNAFIESIGGSICILIVYKTILRFSNKRNHKTIRYDSKNRIQTEKQSTF